MLINEEKQELNTSEGGSFTNYVGIAAREILTVNPTSKEIEELYGRVPNEEPVYVKKTNIGDKEVDRVTLSFRGRIVPVTISFESTVNESNLNNTFNLDKEINKSEAKGTFQVIDELGQSCWVTKEQFTNKEVPQYSSGPAKIDTATWRPAYVGEVDLVNFLKVLFNIPDIQIYQNGVFVDNPKVDKEKLKFWKKEDTEKLLKGQFKELKDAVKACLAKNNVVINFFYTETGSNGQEYQKMMNNLTLKPRYTLMGAAKAFAKQVNKLKDYYKTNNPDKLNSLDLDYVDIIKAKEIKPTDYSNDNPTQEDLPEEDNTLDLPF